MRIVWLPRAQRELSAIRAYIAPENLVAADRMAGRIFKAASLLESNPHMGRRGLLFDTREWVVYPYILVYRIRDDELQILRRHFASAVSTSFTQ